MKKMEPMTPMEPMHPMEPMQPMQRWWPTNLGEPSSVGSQNGLRYAFFPDSHRLLIEREGTVTEYDSGPHKITGIYQPTDVSQIRFTGNHGNVDLGSLRKVERGK
jgi:hypothetical protein